MELLGEITRNLLIIILIASFIEILLPDNTTQPMLRFVIGLFIILAILNPVAQSFFRHQNLETLAWDMPWNDDNQKYQEEGLKLNGEIQQAGEQLMQEKVEKQVNALASLVPGVETVKTKVKMDSGGDEISRLELTLTPSTGDEKDHSVMAMKNSSKKDSTSSVETKEKLKIMLENLYGLDAQDIVIRIEGG
ncbi:MAG: stage III sporulation protein AF [Chitinophagales bacterium]